MEQCTYALYVNFSKRLMFFKIEKRKLPFNFAARVPEAAGPRDVAGPLSGLHVVSIEPQQHVIRWLERA